MTPLWVLDDAGSNDETLEYVHVVPTTGQHQIRLVLTVHTTEAGVAENAALVIYVTRGSYSVLAEEIYPLPLAIAKDLLSGHPTEPDWDV